MCYVEKPETKIVRKKDGR